MIPSTISKTAGMRHAGPSPGIVAIVYGLLFVAGLLLIGPLGGRPGFPNPNDSLDVVLAFFQARVSSVRLFGAL